MTRPCLTGLPLRPSRLLFMAAFLVAALGVSTAEARLGPGLSPAATAYLDKLAGLENAGRLSQAPSPQRILAPAQPSDDLPTPSAEKALAADAWSLCYRAADRTEDKRDLPNGLLRAITWTETSRRSEDGKRMVPWPWTINVEGKGYRFATKAEAIAATRAFIVEGKRSIDVGCAQINLKFHPRAFETMETAFDPAVNLDYAASLLERHRAKTSSWRAAVARYHSGTSALGTRYAQKVFDRLTIERDLLETAATTVAGLAD